MDDPDPEPILGGRFARAAAYAIELHARQARKSTTIPYATHLLAVCSLVLEDGGTEDEAIAALLHDGPEDQGGAIVLEHIRMEFGAEVAQIVAALSDAMWRGEAGMAPAQGGVPRRAREGKSIGPSGVPGGQAAQRTGDPGRPASR